MNNLHKYHSAGILDRSRPYLCVFIVQKFDEGKAAGTARMVVARYVCLRAIVSSDHKCARISRQVGGGKAYTFPFQSKTGVCDRGHTSLIRPKRAKTCLSVRAPVRRSRLRTRRETGSPFCGSGYRSSLGKLGGRSPRLCPGPSYPRCRESSHRAGLPPYPRCACGSSHRRPSSGPSHLRPSASRSRYAPRSSNRLPKRSSS